MRYCFWNLIITRPLSEPTIFEEVLGVTEAKSPSVHEVREDSRTCRAQNLPERGRLVNIQNVEISTKYNDKYYTGLPKIFLEVHKKFEKHLWGKSVVFHDKFGKELFKCKNLRLNWRYYEMYGSARKDKVQFVAENLEFENLGSISHHYLSKIISHSCNVKHKKPSVKHASPDVDEAVRRKRYLDYLCFLYKVKRVRFRAILYQQLRVFRYVFKVMNNKLVTIRLESTAPT